MADSRLQINQTIDKIALVIQIPKLDGEPACATCKHCYKLVERDTCNYSNAIHTGAVVNCSAHEPKE